MASITVKSIPPDLYEKLKISASRNRRSINNEMSCCLESVLMPRRLTVEEKLERARRIRRQIDVERLDPHEIANPPEPRPRNLLNILSVKGFSSSS